MKLKATKGGFTLLELMIAVAIVSALAAMAIPAFNKYIYESRRSEAVAMLGQVWKAQQIYFEVNGYYRPSFSGEERDPSLPDEPGAMQSLNFSPHSGARYNLILGDIGSSPNNLVSLSQFPQYLDGSLKTGDNTRQGLNSYGLGVIAGGTNSKEIMIGAEGRIGAANNKLDILFVKNGKLFLLCDSTDSDPSANSAASAVYALQTGGAPSCIASANLETTESPHSLD